jgi:F-type H+-transporting ATPase subunit epsilon
MADVLTVDIVATDHVLWSGNAESVIAPSVEGEIGLLNNHEPVLSVLAPGRLRVHSANGDSQEFAVTGGFVSFDHNVITAVVDVPASDTGE